MSALGSWLFSFFGLSGTGPIYATWSGWLADITIFGAVVGVYRKHECHEPRCLRIGKHPAADGLYVLCSKHHPDIPEGGITHEHIRSAHQASKGTH